jgi:hypothetical protein
MHTNLHILIVLTQNTNNELVVAIKTNQAKGGDDREVGQSVRFGMSSSSAAAN